MSNPDVNQSSFLARAFERALELHDCSTVALLGCATGNGLQHVKRGRTDRVTAVDINPEYLEVLRQRHASRIPGLEVLQDDLERCELERQAYSLIFAGLVFEYVRPPTLLQKIARWLQVNGVLVAVLQLSAKGAQVTETPYASLKSLDSVMSLVPPERFRVAARGVGLAAIAEETVVLETGKSFYVGTYEASKMPDGPERDTT